MTNQTPKERLECIRRELRTERISMGELAELQDLIEYIDVDDVELLEAAGVPELPAHDSYTCATYNEPVLPDEGGKCSLCGARIQD